MEASNARLGIVFTASPQATPRRYTAGEVSFCPAPAARVPDSAFAHEIYQRAGTDEKMGPARSKLGASLRAAGHYVSWQAERRLTARGPEAEHSFDVSLDRTPGKCCTKNASLLRRSIPGPMVLWFTQSSGLISARVHNAHNFDFPFWLIREIKYAIMIDIHIPQPQTFPRFFGIYFMPHGHRA